MPAPEEVVTRYFDALAARDLDAMAACWAPDGQEHIAGQADVVGPEGVRGYFGELFGSFPDFALSVRRTVAQGDHVTVLWRATATHAGPGTYKGIAPTGKRIALEGIDLLEVRDGLIVRNDAFADGVGLSRQLGLMPEEGSAGERRLLGAFNAGSKVRRRMHVGEPEKVADGVWLVRGGFPLKTMNVYLIEEEGGGVCLFDAGIEDMAGGLRAVGAAMGGITRVVLGHAVDAAARREHEAPDAGAGRGLRERHGGVLVDGPRPVGKAVEISPAGISRTLRGLPYRWGGIDSTTGMDCSGMVFRVMQLLGITVPRDADDQFETAPFKSRKSWKMARRDDLIFFGKDAVTHVGFYLGDGTYISEHGSAGTVVRGVEEDPYWGLARY